MSRAKAATGRRVVSGGSVGDAATISELRRWANRGALAFCTALLGFDCTKVRRISAHSKLNA